MAKAKRKVSFVCAPCGREAIVRKGSAVERVIWCCGKPMIKKSKKTVSRKRPKR